MIPLKKLMVKILLNTLEGFFEKKILGFRGSMNINKVFILIASIFTLSEIT